jgi:hypothetical protein
MKINLLTILLLFSTTACVTLSQPIQGKTPPLDTHFSAKNISNYSLLALDQKITFEAHGEKTIWFSHMELTEQKLALVSFGPLGNELFNIKLENGALSHHGRLKLISPQRLISDLQLAYWPKTKLESLQPSGYVVHAQNAKRSILHNDIPYAFITFEGDKSWQKKITIENMSEGYRLIIEPLRVEFTS